MSVLLAPSEALIPNKMYIIIIIKLVHTLDTLILASKKFHTYEFIRKICYFLFNYFGFPPL